MTLSPLEIIDVFISHYIQFLQVSRSIVYIRHHSGIKIVIRLATQCGNNEVHMLI